MKTFLLTLNLFLYILVYSQDTNLVSKLQKGEIMSIETPNFPSEVQKVALWNNELLCTFLNTQKNIQVFVRYTLKESTWKIASIGHLGTFYAGNGKIGSLVPGGSAHIKNIRNLGNERDLTVTPEGKLWFTSDKTGQFQIYEQIGKKAEKLEIEKLNNFNIINLWSSQTTVYFDAVDSKLNSIENYAWINNKLIKRKFQGNSISFNDSILVYILEKKIIAKKLSAPTDILKFIFVFLDNKYNEGLTLSLKEAKYLEIDSNSIVDGILTQKAKEKILENLNKTSNPLTKFRSTEIKNKLKKTDETISFTFAFLDKNYEKGITLSSSEIKYFELDSNSINDGVLTTKSKQKILEKLESSAHSLPQTRALELKNKLENTEETISFTFAFTDKQYNEGISFNPKEIKQLELNSKSIVDGVLSEETKEKILQSPNYKNKQISTKSKNATSKSIGLQNNTDIIAFYGFFADTSTFVSTQNTNIGVNKSGIISTDGLKYFVENQSSEEKKQKYSDILIRRAWDEEKQIQFKAKVYIQIGAYQNYYSNFPLYLYEKGKISKKDYKFLQSLNILTMFNGGLYLYRTHTTVNNMLKIKKTVYFDKPFIVENK